METPLLHLWIRYPHGLSDFHEGRESMLPDTLFFQIAKEALNEAVLHPFTGL
jgi:hypothetical protein